MLMLCFCLFFFFSSRRRHTRCSRDWSSDVCSSDLARAGAVGMARERREKTEEQHPHRRVCPHSPLGGLSRMRSEEHTSELQSRLHLVCRLLLEKKKKKK